VQILLTLLFVTDSWSVCPLHVFPDLSNIVSKVRGEISLETLTP
jgi:hypothetical protein